MTQVKQGESDFGFYYSWDPRAVSILVHGQGLCGLNFSADTQGESTGAFLSACPNVEPQRKKEGWS